MTINGRVYRLSCEDGEEKRLLQLAKDVGARVDAFSESFGQVGENRLLLLAALRLADELLDAKTLIEKHTGSSLEALKDLKETGAKVSVKARRKAGKAKGGDQVEGLGIADRPEDLASEKKAV